MHDIRQTSSTCPRRQKLHTKERRISIESVIIVGKLDSRNAAVNTGMGSEDFARFIGLTPNQYWKN